METTIGNGAAARVIGAVTVGLMAIKTTGNIDARKLETAVSDSCGGRTGAGACELHDG